MKNLSTSARNADLNSTHRYPYKWELKDLPEKKNGLKVFSFFSCGGGSSMGYKLAGFNVVGNCEIDPAINELYKVNNHPKYNYCMDIRDFIDVPDKEIPDELKGIDILDGSPPCSTFSLAGSREEAWGKEKVFKEGQELQTLDDLFFWYIKAIRKLKPKIFVAENVKGLIEGNAKGYVNQILKELSDAGYTTQMFLLNAATMGVPQKRERVFFIGHRKEFEWPKLKLIFNEGPIRYREFMDDEYLPLNKDTITYKRWQQRRQHDTDLSDATMRSEGKPIGYTTSFAKGNKVCNTLTANTRLLRFDKPGYISDRDVKLIQSFPMDYNFMGQDSCYVCGMSVPPVMMANVATEIYEQWLKETK